MKLPEQPPDMDQVLRNRRDELLMALSDRKYLDFANVSQRYYLPWDTLQFRATSRGLDAELAWIVIAFSRNPQMRIMPLRGDICNLRFTIPDVVHSELMEIDQQLAGQIGSDFEKPFTQIQRERFIINAFREEAIASSMIEGAATTRRDAKQMLRTKRRPKNRSEWMIYNNYQTIMHIREHLDQELSPDFLLELQAMLTENTLEDPEIVGRFRTNNDKVDVVDRRDNVILHVPPDANQLKERLKQLCNFANKLHKQETFIHPVIKACILHFQIGYDHPFCDGNGRTARAVFYWSMLRDGYWLFEYIPISRLIYKSAISYARAYARTEADHFDLTYFLLYKLRIISLARQEFRRYIDSKMNELEQAKSMFKSEKDINQRQRDVIMQFVRVPDRIITIKEYQETHSVVYETARHDLLELVDKHYLVHKKSGKQYIFQRGQKIGSISDKKKLSSIRSTVPRH